MENMKNQTPPAEKGFYGEELRRLLVHDLAGPVTNIHCAEEIMLAQLSKLEQASSEEERKQGIFELRRLIHTIGNSARNVYDLSGILRLEDLTPKDLRKYKSKFSPSEKIKEIIQSYEHQMISQRQLGVELEVSPNLHGVTFNSNVSIFSTVISNLVGNAIKYSIKGSVIKIFTDINSPSFYFEIENMVNSPIDTNILNKLFSRGYRIEGEEKADGSRNEGLGLYLTQRGIKRAYNGEITLSSEDCFKITDKRINGFNRICYGLVHKNDDVPILPSFNANVKLPLENLIIND